MGKVILAAPHSILVSHPQLIPTLERGYCVDAYFENRLSDLRLQQFWQSNADALIICGSLAAATQLTGLPPRRVPLVFINMPYALPEGFSREPMLMLLKSSSEGFHLRLWGQCEKYVELICQIVIGLNSCLTMQFNHMNFTEKEKEVLGMLLQGLRDEYIAKALFISPKTVRNHISNMLRKVRVDSRTHLVLWVLNRQTE